MSLSSTGMSDEETMPLCDENGNYKCPYEYPLIDDFAAIAPRITGAISAISSAVIIFVIYRSKAKLSTIYHRIVCAMSCADIVGSIAMGLTTLPMPREVQPGMTDYGWTGTRLGNTLSCNIQGVCYFFGTLSMFFYNFALIVYYTCAVVFRMKEERIKKYVEPLLHLVPITVGLAISLTPLFFDLYNASGYQAWCTVTQQDARGTVDPHNVTDLAVTLLILAPLFVIVCCFSMIVWRVHNTSRVLQNLSATQASLHRKQRWNSNNVNKVLESHLQTKVALIQSCVYTASYVTSLILPFWRAIGPEAYIIPRLQVIIMPLQGLYNCIIFIAHKMYIYKRANPDLSNWYIFCKLFKSFEDPIYLSRISMISYDRLDNLDLNPDYLHNNNNNNNNNMNNNIHEMIRIRVTNEQQGNARDEEYDFDLSYDDSFKDSGMMVEIDDDDGDIFDDNDGLSGFSSILAESGRVRSSPGGGGGGGVAISNGGEHVVDCSIVTSVRGDD